METLRKVVAGLVAVTAHLPFPGIGHIRAEGQGYVYVPANYSVPR